MEFNELYKTIEMRSDELYKTAEQFGGIHLGLADKMLIYNLIRDYNLDTIDDISSCVRRHFFKFGYTSFKLLNLNKKVKEHEIDFANYVLERYGYPKIS